MGRNLISQITKAYDYQKQIETLRNEPFQLPLDLMSPMMEYMMERSYLEDMTMRSDFISARMPNQTSNNISWIKIHRIPVHPSQLDNYDLLTKWQSVLTSLHAWNCKMIFLLQRKHGETNLYVGLNAGSLTGGIGLLRSALINCMPGIEAEPIDNLEAMGMDEQLNGTMALSDTMESYSVAGVITGIPSFRKETQSKFAQTLDQLAFGIRTERDEEADFSLIVVAQPMTDGETSDIINRYQKLGSDIHSEVTAHVTDTETKTDGESTSTGGAIHFGIAQIMDTAAFLIGGPLLTVASKGASFAAATLLGTSVNLSKSYSSSHSVQVGRSVAKDYLNKFAQFTEKLTDMHCERLRKGRNLGFWNVGTYVMGYRDEDVTTVLGILRSIYSGDETYVEPIRMHLLHQEKALEAIKGFNLIPVIHPDSVAAKTKDPLNEEWHVLGKAFQYLSTPLNTEELSLETSLPRRDVPGLRFVRSSVRFANNPGINNAHGMLSMGKIVDSGVIQSNDYSIDINALVRHSLIVGSTGCGKTTTCKTIINEVLDRDIPVLIIEPAKDEYVRWAIKQNEKLPDSEKINIFMPGVKNLEQFGVMEGVRALPPLKLNPFQPAAIDGAPIDMLTRCEQLTALVNASLPTSDILPVIIDEAFFTFLNDIYKSEFSSGEMEQKEDYPKLDKVLPVARKILDGRGYSQEVANGLAAALDTRFKYLVRGKRGEVLNVFRSTPYSKLFNQTTVVNLSKIANQKDKAFIMSLLMLSLYEYRVSAYTYDAEYRKKAQKNELLHMTVVEEAHNVLARPSADFAGVGNPQQVVADLFGNMLSEIRSYGEGLMIVDQVPTRLIDDAIRNTNYKIAHRLSAKDDVDVMAAALGLRIDQQDLIPLLQQGQAIISCDKDDAASWVMINKPKILM
ncbi:ATP-binding protein [Bacteroides congonensis]